MLKPRILLVENQETLGIIFINGLKDFEILVMGCHKKLPLDIEKVTKFNPDILVTDHGFDGNNQIDGIGIIEQLKKMYPKIECFVRTLPLNNAIIEELTTSGVPEKRLLSKHLKEEEFGKIFLDALNFEQQGLA